jgi:hypothetical protein
VWIAYLLPGKPSVSWEEFSERYRQMCIGAKPLTENRFLVPFSRFSYFWSKDRDGSVCQDRLGTTIDQPETPL